MYKTYHYGLLLLISINSIAMQQQPNNKAWLQDPQQSAFATLAGMPDRVKMHILYQIAENHFRSANGNLRDATNDMRSLFFTCKAYAQFMYDDDATGWLIAHLVPVSNKRWHHINERANYAAIDAAVALRTVSSARDLIKRFNTHDDEKLPRSNRWAMERIFWGYLTNDDTLKTKTKTAYLKMLCNAGCCPERGTLYGITPLMVAIMDANPQLAVLFLAKKPDLSLDTINSETAEDLLKRCNQKAKEENNQQAIKNLKTIKCMLEAYKARNPQDIPAGQRKKITRSASEKCIIS